jgi:hypothetical protein
MCKGVAFSDHPDGTKSNFHNLWLGSVGLISENGIQTEDA